MAYIINNSVGASAFWAGIDYGVIFFAIENCLALLCIVLYLHCDALWGRGSVACNIFSCASTETIVRLKKTLNWYFEFVNRIAEDENRNSSVNWFFSPPNPSCCVVAHVISVKWCAMGSVIDTTDAWRDVVTACMIPPPIWQVRLFNFFYFFWRGGLSVFRHTKVEKTDLNCPMVPYKIWKQRICDM